MDVVLFFKPEASIPSTLPCGTANGYRYHTINGPVELAHAPSHVSTESVEFCKTRTRLRKGNYRFSGEYRLGAARAIVQTRWHYVGMYTYEFYTVISISSTNLVDLQRLFRRLMAGTILPTIWHPGAFYNPVTWIGRTINTLRTLITGE